MGESLEEIVAKVASADALVAEISTAAKEQSQGIQQVGVAMTQLDKVTQGNATNAQQSASAAEQLNSQAHVMQDTVSFLRSLVTGVQVTNRSGNNGSAPRAKVALRQPQGLPSRAAARPALRYEGSARPLADARRAGAQIPMPEDKGAGADQEDRNFTNF